MKSPLRIFTFWLLLVFIHPHLYSHPLDITLTTIQIQDEYIYGTTYFHPYEISLLARDAGITVEIITTDELYHLLVPYFKKHFMIFGSNGLYFINEISLENTEVYEILSSGVYINFSIKKNHTSPCLPLSAIFLMNTSTPRRTSLFFLIPLEICC